MAPASPAARNKPLPPPALSDGRSAPVHIMPKPIHPHPALPARKHKKARLDTPPASPSRRRAPALERLPRWLFAPVRHFVSARSELPLPQRVAVGGKPFYDWDAWAISLLHPSLWRRRGPWQRLVAGCTGWKPPVVDSIEAIKSALVRIVVADVVSLLVGRSGDQLTPEDRNWITSVASRQRGRDQRKPTLMLLFDLAFPLFDLAAYCRARHKPPHALALKDAVQTDDPVARDVVRLVIESMRFYEANSTLANAKRDTKAANQIMLDAAKDTQNTDLFVINIMQLIDPTAHVSSDTTTIGTVRHVVNAIQAILDRLNAPRWYKSYSSPGKLRIQSLKRIAFTFVERFPLPDATKDAADKDIRIGLWARSAFLPDNWRFWAELANDFSYMNLNPTDRDLVARADLCEHIVTYLQSDDRLSMFEEDVDDSKHDIKPKPPVLPDELALAVRKILDIAINLEQFFALFVETYGNDSSTPSDIAWLVGLFERVVQDLSAVRDFFIMGSAREKAMVEWSARSLDMSSYYREAISGSPDMCEDIDRAVQNAFSEASWSPQTRTMRFMVQQPCYYPPSVGKGQPVQISQAYQFWVATLDLRDPLYQAVAIVPWDPQRALRLLDSAVGITDAVKQEVVEGRHALPLWDYRRVAICRLAMCRGNFPQAVLILERLQVLFDQKSLHEGGNFSADTIRYLEGAASEGNLCAQTTHGLLLAGEGTYWEVARRWAGCEKSTVKGVEKLYSSAIAGDLEACTALSHIWAQCGSDDTDVFKGVALEQIFALFKIAVTSQNAQAVMNLGVIWRYGVSCLQANMTIATDAFLMALQGALIGEARSVAAQHLAETVGDAQPDVAETLSRLSSGDRADCSSTSSPNRIDDFRAPSE